MATVGTCRLHEQRETLCKAHIFPRFAYSLTRQDPDFLPRSYGRDGSERRVPGGLYDPKILCAEADKYIGDWLDDFAATVLAQVPEPTEEQTRRCESVNISAEVNQFKLFLLSVLWRAHISSRPEFESVNIGAKLSSEILSLIKEKRLPSNWHFQFVIRRYNVAKEDAMFMPPVRKRMSGRTVYDMAFGGFSFLLWTDSRTVIKEFGELSNKSGNQITVFYEDFWKSGLFKEGSKIVVQGEANRAARQ